jgi:NADH-quinone oxidoreductase subunit E/NADP-reducing hydrogenase subunit HndA
MKAEDTELLKEFTPEQVVKLGSIIEKHKGKPGGLIPVLKKRRSLSNICPYPCRKRLPPD